MTQGLILINKPKGITSFSVVSKIKWLLHEKRVGHTGTLDPMATGVLPIFVGRATALSSFLLDADKVYTATFRFGITTDTADITGNILNTRPVSFTNDDLEKAFLAFTGEIMQVPPMYSALKRDGVPLYKLAREGKTVDIPARKITVNFIEPVSVFLNNEITVRVSCSKGTYIRSLCNDIGEYLGCGATLTNLRRDETSGFTLKDCVSLDDLTQDNVRDYLTSEENAVKNLRQINVSEKQAIRFTNGGQLSTDRLNASFTKENELLRVKYGNTLLGIGCADLENGQVAVKCVIRQSNEINKTAIALGTFDGVHIGHKAVINAAVNSGFKPIAVTFEKPPKAYFDSSIGQITTAFGKDEKLRECGIKEIHYIDFAAVRNMSPLEFLEHLKTKYNPAFICCGFNYRFGKNGAGDTALLERFCKENDIALRKTEPVTVGNEVVSSSIIRKLLLNGEIKKANSLLGYEFYVNSEIIHGDSRGRQIGFPTANQIYPENLIKVKFGVYKSRTTVNGRTYNSITNIGLRPTFETERIGLETYILDFDGDIYGQVAKVALLSFIREEKKFGSIDELKAAIEEDTKK